MTNAFGRKCYAVRVLANLRAIEAGAVRAAREAKDQKVIHAFGSQDILIAGL